MIISEAEDAVNFTTSNSTAGPLAGRGALFNFSMGIRLLYQNTLLALGSIFRAYRVASLPPGRLYVFS